MSILVGTQVGSVEGGRPARYKVQDTKYKDQGTRVLERGAAAAKAQPLHDTHHFCCCTTCYLTVRGHVLAVSGFFLSLFWPFLLCILSFI
jgi:hypothetical protein